MPITVQQFDLIAEVNGSGAALAAAEQAGGVVGTRADDIGTQIEVGPRAGGSTAQLSGQGGEFLPGTLVTDTSRTIGEAGSAYSGQVLNRPGGGGQTGVNLDSRLLADIMSAAAAANAAPIPFTSAMKSNCCTVIGIF